jgi:hypothetical protein
MMSQVFREQTFKYRGEDVTFTPDMQLLRRIDQMFRASGTDAIQVAQGIGKARPDLFSLSYALQQFLKSGGVDAAEDECYAYLSSGGGNDVRAIQSFYVAFFNAFLPEIDQGKKPEAPAQKKAAKRNP